MPFDQLRALVISLIEPEPELEAEFDPDPAPDPIDDDRMREFDTQATHCLGPRTSTLDQLIAFLRKQ